MEKSTNENLPKTDFTALKKPSTFIQKTNIKYKQHLDELYSEKWLIDYFKLTDNVKKS